MADEFDRKLIPAIFQETFTLSLGAAYKSLELMKHPEEGLGKVMSTVKDLVTVPAEEANGGLQEKAQALAGVWLEKSATIISECRSAGQKFTEGK